MLFNEAIGQEAVKLKLINSVKNNRVSHAQLFFGPEGCGILPLAIAYAQYISCTHRRDDDSCGHCPSCNKFNRLIHPDLHFSFPVAATKDVTGDLTSSKFLSKWREAILQNPYLNLFQWLEVIGVDNKQGNISVYESNEIVKKLSLKPYESEYKTIIIWLPEKMHLAAANKLLKILEEPPEKTLFILATHQVHAVLKTIVSRTQIVKITGIDDASLEEFVRVRQNLPVDAARKIARLGNGNYLRVLRHLEESGSSHFEIFRKWMQLAYKSNILSMAALLDDINIMGREKQKNFLEYGIHLLREAYIWRATGGKLNRTSDAEKEFIINLSPFLNHVNYPLFTEEFEAAHHHIERNVNPKFIFFDLSLKMCELISGKFSRQPTQLEI